MKFVETSIVAYGKVFFDRVWTCCGNKWEEDMIEWDDLESLAWCPVCNICGGTDGSIFI